MKQKRTWLTTRGVGVPDTILEACITLAINRALAILMRDIGEPDD